MKMAKSKNDRLFCILTCCRLNVSFKLLSCLMYLLQLSGWNLNYEFSMGTGNVKCRVLSSNINDAIANGLIEENSQGKLALTRDGITCLSSFVLTAEDFDNIEYIVDDLVNTLTLDELNFVCITDMLLNEITTKYGSDGLVKYKETVSSTLQTLSNCYSVKNFDSAIKLINSIKE